MDGHPLSIYAAESGRSITKIAEAAGCSRMTLYRIMRSEQNTTVDLLERVSAATEWKVPVSALLPRRAATQ